MTELPFRGNVLTYRGRNEQKRRRTAEQNRLVARIARHANMLVANNRDEVQMLSFAGIALDLGCEVEAVRLALSDGGYNGITIRVTPEDREALTRFKSGAN